MSSPNTKINARDAQFSGAASSLYLALAENRASLATIAEQKQLIARFLSDYTRHFLEYLPRLINAAPNAQSTEEVLTYLASHPELIPDMTEWKNPAESVKFDVEVEE